MHKAVSILAGTTQGREALLEIIEQFGGFTSASSNDPIEQARLVARRGVATDIIKHLLTDIRNPFTIMMNERFERLQADRAKGNRDDDGE